VKAAAEKLPQTSPQTPRFNSPTVVRRLSEEEEDEEEEEEESGNVCMHGF
jgi:hypothetical protein